MLVFAKPSSFILFPYPPKFTVLHLLLPSDCGSSLIAVLVIEIKFETGDEKLKDLELGVFVGAGRFLVEKGKPVVVEYKISKIVKGV